MDGWRWVDDVNLLAHVDASGAVDQVVDAATFRAKYARGQVGDIWLRSQERVDVERTVFMPGVQTPKTLLNAAGPFGCTPSSGVGENRIGCFFERSVCGGHGELARHLLKLLKAALLGRQTKVLLLLAGDGTDGGFFERVGERVFGNALYARVRCYDYVLQPDYPALVAYTPLVVADADVPDPKAAEDLLRRHRRGERLCRLLGPKLDPCLIVYVGGKQPELVQAHIGMQDVQVELPRLTAAETDHMNQLFTSDRDIGDFLRLVLDQKLGGFVPWRVPKPAGQPQIDSSDSDASQEEEEETNTSETPARAVPDVLTCFVRWWCVAHTASQLGESPPAARTTTMLRFYQRVREMCPDHLENVKVTSPQRLGVALQQQFPVFAKCFKRTKKGKVFHTSRPNSLRLLAQGLDKKFWFDAALIQDGQCGLKDDM
jgi:hypothetical protein